jgi:L,D-transpeptidase catalytic domain
MRWWLGVLAAFGCVLAGCATTGPVPSLGPPVPSTVGSSASPRGAVSVPLVAPRRPPTVPNPCAINSQPQLVEVSVARQHMWLCARTTVAYQAPVTTGIPTEDYHTPTGRYVIQAKQTHQTLTLLSGDRYVVAYWIPFDAPLFGFHDAAWQTFPYGSARYATDGSHGCVHLPLAAIAWLYRWVRVGTPVLIS